MPAQRVGAPEKIHVHVGVTIRAADHGEASAVNHALLSHAGVLQPIGQQIVDVRADSRRIGVTLRLPVTVDLPAWPREAMIVGVAPLVNRVVRRAESAIRPEVRGRCRGASRR